MTIREIAIAKLQQLPESFLPEVSEFIDFVMHKHQNRIAEPKLPGDIAKAWAKWFEEVDRLEVTTNEPESEYQQLLLNKYRQQGLDL
ncbi:MAG: hypothetical protein MUE44_19455 [Oscillatoriaceae cyanobacterium Prado104]|jgi:hypothetical protein|nr:hypothetical protein [Oscillatoriaceae cyanobacterium Prado104]